MPLHPQARVFLDRLPGGPPIESLPVPEVRASVDAMLGMFAGPPAEVARVHDHYIPGPGGTLPVRIYTPAGDGPHPVVVYCHGGGWVIGSLESHDATCRALAATVPCQVVAVDYRLAPEHPFPAAADDALAAASWVVAHAASFGGDPARVAVAGDSAGGNLAAAVALMARDRGGPRLVHQLLIYPVTDGTMSQPSMTENADGYFLTRDTMAWFWSHYAGTGEARRDPYASPLAAPDLTGLPPATVLTAEFDPLRDEGEAYAARLQAAGVPTTATRYAGMIHGFFGMFAAFDSAREALDEAARALRSAFAPPT